MLKLYKRVEGALHYHEAWVDDDEGAVVEHWGRVGDDGENRNHPLPAKYREKTLLKQVLAAPLADGYAPIDDDDHAVLIVEYPIDGMGTDVDLDRRQEIEEHLADRLGWTGLGQCDGGSIGSGTMEVCCYVVEFALARDVIAKELADNGYAGFSRIYDEDAPPLPQAETPG